MNRDLQSILSNFKLNTSSYNKLRLLEKEMLQEYGTLKYEKIGSLKHSITMIEKKEHRGRTKKYMYKVRGLGGYPKSSYLTSGDMTSSFVW